MMERRRKPRAVVLDEQIVPVSLQNDNGGLVVDLSENGLAVQAIAALQRGAVIELEFSLPESNTRIGGRGDVRWAEASGRAGIRIVAFTAGSAEDIRKWISGPGAKRSNMQPAGTALDTSPVVDLIHLDRSVSELMPDLDSALQYVVDRTREMSGATGAAIALGTSGDMLCRASSGAAPTLGVRLQSESGLSGECVRTRTLVRCDDTETDIRVDANVCRQLSLRSAVIVPVTESEKLTGVLEVFSDRPHAFGTEDIQRLRQTAELIATLARKFAVSELAQEPADQDRAKNELPPRTAAMPSQIEPSDVGKTAAGIAPAMVTAAPAVASAPKPAPLPVPAATTAMPPPAGKGVTAPVEAHAAVKVERAVAAPVESRPPKPAETQRVAPVPVPAAPKLVAAEKPAVASPAKSEVLAAPPAPLTPKVAELRAHPKPVEVVPSLPLAASKLDRSAVVGADQALPHQPARMDTTLILGSIELPDREMAVETGGGSDATPDQDLIFPSLPVAARTGIAPAVKIGIPVAAALLLVIAILTVWHSRRASTATAATPPTAATAVPASTPAATPASLPVEVTPTAVAKEHAKLATNAAKPTKPPAPVVRQVGDADIRTPETPVPSSTPPSISMGSEMLPNLAVLADTPHGPAPQITSRGVVPGRLIQQVAPEYPTTARAARIGGEVVLNAIIREDGTIGTVQVVKGNPILAKAAVQAVRQWRYEPYKLNGSPVQADATIRLRFDPTAPPR